MNTCECVCMLGGNVCDTVGEHTVVREASDVWERSPDRQEASPCLGPEAFSCQGGN